MANMCVPNIVKRVNMKVYNFLMRLNETRNVLWHYKKCFCKNKLIGRIIAECTNVINETMVNNKLSITNDDTTTNIFIGLFSVFLFIGIVFFFAYLLISNILKVKNYFKKIF